MKSRTSFFNKTALRKDILRYSPIWALYTIVLVLVLFSLIGHSKASTGRNLIDFLKAMTWINLLYGGICGVCLFGDLFKNRLCNALHAFPLRREGWLATHILAGVLFSIVPNLLFASINALLLWEYAYVAAFWLAIATMQFLFFFGTAVLAATCAGNRLGAVAIYSITHFITFFIYTIAGLLYQPLLHGIQLNQRVFYDFFPLDQLDSFDYVLLESYGTGDWETIKLTGLEGNAWGYAGICAAAGVLALFLACLVYRRRNLETAGDFVSLKLLAPVFLLVATVGAGAFVYAFLALTGTASFVSLVIGMAIGFFAGKMLLNRTVKVFGKKSILAFAVLVAVMGGSFLVTVLDPLGIVTYVPDSEKIEAAYIYGADKGYYRTEYLITDYVGDEYDSGFAITGGHELAELQDFHRQLTRYRPSKDDGTLCDVRIHYKLKNGRTVTRYYDVGRNTALGQRAGKYFSDMRYIFEVNDTEILYDAFASSVVSIHKDGDSVDVELVDRQEIAGLLDAIAADCEAGTMAQNWAFHEETGKEKDYNVEFSLSIPDIHKLGLNTNRFHLKIYPDSVNTIEYMNNMIQLHTTQE